MPWEFSRAPSFATTSSTITSADRSNGIILDAGAAAMRVEYNVVHNVLGIALV